jgi:hypothetical protein
MDRLKSQANTLWQLISNPSTAATYQQTLGTTWAILRETGLLLWLFVCLVFVLGDWFWQTSYATGQKARAWIDDMQTSAQEPAAETSSGDMLGKTGKSLLSAGRSSLSAALSAAKGQLGMESTETPAPKPIGLIPPFSEKTAPELTASKPTASPSAATPETPPADSPEV